MPTKALQSRGFDPTKDIEDYLVDPDGYNINLSHALLKRVYYEKDCISCLDAEDKDLEMCRALVEVLCLQGLGGAFKRVSHGREDYSENDYSHV